MGIGHTAYPVKGGRGPRTYVFDPPPILTEDYFEKRKKFGSLFGKIKRLFLAIFYGFQCIHIKKPPKNLRIPRYFLFSS